MFINHYESECLKSVISIIGKNLSVNKQNLIKMTIITFTFEMTHHITFETIKLLTIKKN